MRAHVAPPALQLSPQHPFHLPSPQPSSQSGIRSKHTGGLPGAQGSRRDHLQSSCPSSPASPPRLCWKSGLPPSCKPPVDFRLLSTVSLSLRGPLPRMSPVMELQPSHCTVSPGSWHSHTHTHTHIHTHTHTHVACMRPVTLLRLPQQTLCYTWKPKLCQHGERL